MTAAPVWEKSSLSLGSLDMDGGLRQRFVLGNLAGSPEFSFPIYLEHAFRASDVVTEYKIPQLETYVVPEGREEILWLEPGGTRHVFKKKDVLKSAPADLKLLKIDWVAVEGSGEDSGDQLFYSPDGWIYRYRAGSIYSLTAPTTRVMRFDTEGLRISRIWQEADQKEVTLLEAKENDIGQPESVRIGAEVHQFEYDEKSEQLRSWHSPSMGKDEDLTDAKVTFTYSEQGQVSSLQMPQGETLTYRWGGNDGVWQKDAGLQLPQKENAVFLIADHEFTYQYGIAKNGINLLRTDQLGITDGFAYNPRTQQMIRKHRDGGESTEFFGVRGASENRLESVRDSKGRETVRLTYDDKGRVKSRTSPGLAPFSYEYDELDRITKILRDEKVVTAYEYEGDSQRPTKITDALDQVTEMHYTPTGQLERYKNADGVEFRYIYDALGQLTEEVLPMNYRRTIKRDSFGRITQVTEPDGKQINYSYTEENRLSSIKDGSTLWSYAYQPDGTLSELLRDGNSWQKNEREKIPATGETIIRKKDQDGDETVLQFDKQGNLVRQVDALKQETKFRHDAIGRVTGWQDPRGASTDLAQDEHGRIIGVSQGSADTPQASPQSTSQPSSDAPAALEMAYDLTGRIRAKSNGEQEIKFGYNKQNQLTRIDYGKGQTIDYSYDSLGRVLTATTGQGVKSTYAWDALDRKISERTDLPDGSATEVAYTYTGTNLTKSVTVSQRKSATKESSAKDHENLPLTVLQETTYHYDPLGRYEKISVNGQDKIHYHYDPQIMLLTRKDFTNGWSTAFTYNPDKLPHTITTINDKKVTTTQAIYTWTSDSKLQSRTLNNVHQIYTYDKLGRLIAVETKD